MPFKSKAQMRFMYAKHPTIARRFAKHSRSPKHPGKGLPQHVRRKKR